MTPAVRPRTLRRIASRERQRGYLGLNSYRRLAASARSGPVFFSQLTTSIAPDKAAPGTAPTFTRATTKTFTDWEGVVRTALAGEACFTGARRVRNFVTGSSNDITNAAWAKNQGGVGVAPTATANFAIAPDGTATASRVQFAPGGTISDYSRIQHLLGSPGIAGGRTSIWLRTNDATAKLMKLRSASASADELTVTVTGTWQRFAGPVNTNVASAVEVYTDGTLNSGAAVDLLVWGAQWEDLRGASNQNPSEYVSTGVLSAPFQGANVDGVQYFATQNGNTVTNNVVTAGTGAAIPASVLLGYSAWQASTNLALQSEDLTTTWTLGAATIAANGTASPAGTVTADKIQEDNTTASHNTRQAFTKAASALVYTFSVYVKQAERTWCEIVFWDGTNGNRFWFNLATGVVGSTAVIGTGFTTPTFSIAAAANGFWRCIVTATSTTATALQTWIGASTGDAVDSYLGTTGSGIFAWGAQLEQVAFATPYIATTTAAVARSADNLNFPASGNVNTSAQSAYAEVVPGSSAVSVILAYGPTGADSWALFEQANTTLRQQVFAASATVEDIQTVATMSVGAVNKVASKYSPSDSGLFVAGAKSGSTVNPTGTPAAPATMYIGNQSVGTYLNGNVRNVKIWNRALADAELVQATS